jgi:HPt (histidine-containing phosphotransfer) domain-containing protein
MSREEISYAAREMEATAHRSESTFGASMLLDLFDGDRAAVVDLLRAATRTIGKDVRRIEEARDSRALVEAAHSLKGASANIGSTRIAHLCASIEQTAHSSASLADGRIAELREATSALITEIERFSA